MAAAHHEWEIVLDIFDPVNCRSLMAFLLSVPRELRSFGNERIHRTAIEPDVARGPCGADQSRDPCLRGSDESSRARGRTKDFAGYYGLEVNRVRAREQRLGKQRDV